jgi:hypothetical protein
VLSSEKKEQVLGTVVSWVPPGMSMSHGSQWRKFFRQKLPTRSNYQKVVVTSVAYLTIQSGQPFATTACGVGDIASLSLNNFSYQISGWDLFKGEGCNTPGVKQA